MVQIIAFIVKVKTTFFLDNMFKDLFVKRLALPQQRFKI